MKPVAVAFLFTLLFAGAAATLTYSVMRDLLTHRVDGSTCALAALALCALLVGTTSAIDALNRLELLP